MNTNRRTTTWYAIVVTRPEWEGTILWRSAASEREPEVPAVFPGVRAAQVFRKRVAKTGLFSATEMEIVPVKISRLFRYWVQDKRVTGRRDLN